MAITMKQERTPALDVPMNPSVSTTVKVDDEDGFHELLVSSSGRISVRTMNDNHAGAVDEFVDPKFAGYLSTFLGRLLAQVVKKKKQEDES
jgi:hypothetical protein